jgi:cell volume regulation protein A
MSQPELAALGRSLMARAHDLILVGGALGVVSILAGQLSRRVGAPVLLVLLGIGMLAGEDGVLGIPFDNFYTAYVVGSIALAVILFEGGLKMRLSVLRPVAWPALALATAGVAITALIVGGAVSLIAPVPLAAAMLVGAAAAPTDAAAVTGLLRGARVPERVAAVLELESGLNDPMSIFLTILMIDLIIEPSQITVGFAALMFVREMGGGLVLGVGGGWMLSLVLRRMTPAPANATVLALTGSLALFGLTQSLGASGFLAVYVAGLLVGMSKQHAHRDVELFFEGLGWLAEIVLFLMLGLLITPHDLPPYILPSLVIAAALIFVARPVAAVVCLAPFRFPWRDVGFASWVGLRGAVPIYLSFLPALADPARDTRLFAGVFIIVIASVAVQGTTIPLLARLLGYGTATSPASSRSTL